MMFMYSGHNFHTIKRGNTGYVLELKTEVQFATRALSKSARRGGGNGSMARLTTFVVKLLISKNIEQKTTNWHFLQITRLL